MTPRIPILFNTQAKWSVEGVRAALAEAGVEHLAELRECAPSELGRQVASSVASGANLIAVAGGDGSQMTAAQELAGHETALLPFPAGTLNTFATRAGIASLADAAALLRAAHVVSRAAGVLDDRLFLDTAIIGAYPAIVRRRDRLRRWLPKWPAALAAFAAAGLRRLRRNPVRLEIEGLVIDRQTDLIWIGVGRGSYPLTRRPVSASGEVLEIAVLRELSRRELVRFLVGLLRHALWPGQPRPSRQVELFHARRLVIRSAKRLDATLDGEPFPFESPVFLALQPDALRVVTPS